MYTGDIAAILQIVESAVAPVAPLAPVRADPQSTSGQRFSAFVQQSLPDGQFNVSVSGRTLQLALPAQTAVGQTVQLRQAPDGGWALADAPATTASWTDMSQVGRLVDQLLQAPPAAAPATAPLLAAAPAATEQAVAELPHALASALAAAVGDSGLFYESHLQQWNAGGRTLTSLAQEPQMRLGLRTAATPVPLSATADPAAPAIPASNVLAPSPAAAPESALPAAAPQDASGVAASAPSAASSTMSANLLQAGVHPDALPIIARQLSTLETGNLTWRGELWPGQNMDWSITRDDDTDESGNPAQGRGRADAAPVWRTRLGIDLPQLGDVTVNLALQGNALRIRLAAAPASREKLGAAVPALSGALSQAGLSMQAMEFEHVPAA